MTTSVWHETYTTKRGKRYLVRWRENGKKKAESFTHYDQVIEFKDKKRKELHAVKHGLHVAPDARSFKVQAAKYLEDAATYKGKNTVEHFDRPALSKFSEFAGNLNPHKITEEKVRDWKLHLLKTYKPSTARIYLRCLRTALNYMKVSPNPVKAVQMPKVEDVGRIVTPKELEALCAEVSKPVRKAMEFTYHTGVRLGELESLKWEDIKKVRGYIHATVRGKTGERTILLHPKAVKAMGKRGKGTVFLGARDWFGESVRLTAKALKLGRIRWHDFRHTFATRYMEKTGDLFGLMAYCGWKSIASVKVYQHVTPERSKAVLKL